MALSVDDWCLVLEEVRRQAARVLQSAGVQAPETDGVWYDVAEGMNRSTELDSVDENGAWQQLQWLNAFQVLFFQRPTAEQEEHTPDDLLFFVLADPYLEDPKEPLLVRRKGKTMPADLDIGGARSEHVDWCKSTLLNLALQTSYMLTVTSCWREDLKAISAREEDLPLPYQAVRVAKHVYASPTRMAVNVDNTKSSAEAPVNSYPELCFAVDNFEDAFISLVLPEPGWCYAVFLTAKARMLDLPQSSAGAEDLRRETQSEQSAVVPPGDPLHHLHRGQEAVAASSSAVERSTDSLRDGPEGGTHNVDDLREVATCGSSTEGWPQGRVGNNLGASASSSAEGRQGPRRVGDNLRSHNSLTREGPQGPSRVGDNLQADGSSNGEGPLREDPVAGARVTGFGRDTRAESLEERGRTRNPLGEGRMSGAALGRVAGSRESGKGSSPVPETLTVPRDRDYDCGSLGDVTRGQTGSGNVPRRDQAGEATIGGEGRDGMAEKLAEQLRKLGIEATGGVCVRNPRARARERHQAIELFAGFVTYEQLEQVTLERRGFGAGAPRDIPPVLVKMRGPGGQGHADVAVTCMLPRPLQAEKPAKEEQGEGRSRQQPFLRRAMKSAVGAAAAAAKAIVNETFDILAGGVEEGTSALQMRCALMSLSLPVESLASRILQIPPR